jgi:hypothetical protein
VLLGSTRISSGGRNQADLAYVVGGALGEQRRGCRCHLLDASGFIVELEKLCRVENGFALVVTHQKAFPSRLRFCSGGSKDQVLCRVFTASLHARSRDAAQLETASFQPESQGERVWLGSQHHSP